MTEENLQQNRLLATHWGTYVASDATGEGAPLHALPGDPNPSPIGFDLPASRLAPARILKPAIRKSWLESQGLEGRSRRGAEPFVEVSWDTAISLGAMALERVRQQHGNSAIYGGSYGWSSAGRFHHAQSQVHRFLNCIGGYTRSVQNYSYAAGDVILPHVVGTTEALAAGHPTWRAIRGGNSLVIMFGGIPLKNAQVDSGGIVQHRLLRELRRCRVSGSRFVSVSPIRDDSPAELDAQWLAPRPNTDVALMLGVAHVLVTESLCDRDFLDRYTVGFDVLEGYILGRPDGVAKTPEWAAGITGLEAGCIRQLASEMAAHNTFIMLTWSLQRAQHGEQPYWMAIALASMLGGIGLPGQGVGFGYGSMGNVGFMAPAIAWPALPQGRNAAGTFIPVARIADLLLRPGDTYDYNGSPHTYPDIELVYWAGGNPFHHHQDLNRLVTAWRKPQTVIVHEAWWNAHARQADIVLPVSTFFERDDISCTNRAMELVASRRVCDPPGECLDDYEIFSRLAERMGVGAEFTEGRDAGAWIRRMYEQTAFAANEAGQTIPSFEQFWATGFVEMLPNESQHREYMEAFRRDPVANPLRTPSGRIELASQRIAAFRYADCPGHPAWLEPCEWLGSPLARQFPLHLLSNQPGDKLHSQWDHASLSRDGKVKGRTRIRMHPQNAADRGLHDGDIVRVHNSRGSVLAGVHIEPAMREGVVQMPTGSWYDPLQPGAVATLDKHGNPNVLTPDIGTSSLAQGPSPNTCLVEVERFDGQLPELSCFERPRFAA